MTRPLPIRFPNEHKLANRVAQSPRLVALLPEAELAPLVASYEAADRAAKAAASTQFAEDDIATEVHRALQAGEDIDAPAVLARITQAAASRTAFAEAQTFFAGLPSTYKQVIAALIGDCLPDLYDGLATQLDDVLDQAESVVAALDGAYDAEAALDTGRTDEFARFRDLAAEYASVRDAHVALLRSEDESAFTVGSDTLAYAFFTNIAATYPQFLAASREGTHVGGWQTSPDAPWPITDPASRDHFLGVVLGRVMLKPRIAQADEAKANRAEAVRALRDTSFSPGPRVTPQDRDPHAWMRRR